MNNPDKLTIKKLLNGSSHYLIPVYQRNYAWEEDEITQLIQDIIDSLKENGNKLYYIGILVVYKRKDKANPVYETIDGQQRLTTIALIASYLKNLKGDFCPWYKDLCIDFECRDHSSKTMDAIFNGKFNEESSELLKYEETNTAILNGYRIIERILPLLLKENGIDASDLLKYLFENVIIMRVPFPDGTDDTDLNHYFEVMNNRGEQLEKHEVLKADLLGILDSEVDDTNKELNKSCFNDIWDACANMDKYVQTAFSKNQRNILFGNAGTAENIFNQDFNSLIKTLNLINQGPEDSDKNSLSRKNEDNSEKEPPSLLAIISYITLPEDKDSNPIHGDTETSERFKSVINFPNFLLHVLRIQTSVTENNGICKDIRLDDKKLIDAFRKNIIKKENNIERVKQFACTLLQCRYLFDHYIIKREYLTDRNSWSLKAYDYKEAGVSYSNTFGKKEDETGNNRRILMLLSAFEVSSPSNNYKYWLNAALQWLYENKSKIDGKEYLNQLESVANAFLFDRFLSEISIEYDDIIYGNKGTCKSTRDSISDNEDTIKDFLNYNKLKNIFVFNFLDYRLWSDYTDGKMKKTDKKIETFEFKYRSSVEHHFPRNPDPDDKSVPINLRHSFGNLCLISHNKNSQYSNHPPHIKYTLYKKTTENEKSIDSIKQHLMMIKTKSDSWNEKSIEEHCNEMIDVLKNSL